VPAEAEKLVDDLLAATDEALALGEAIADEDWERQPCAGDERSVAQVFHHIAVSLRTGTEWVNAAVAGVPVQTTRAEQDSSNERDAAALPEPEREETLLLLRELRDEMMARVRELSGEELARSVFWAGPKQDFSAAQFAALTAGHTRRHLADIKTALG
jgi:DinB family protein